VQQCPVNAQKVLVVTTYVPSNTPSNDWKSLIFSNLVGYSPKMFKMFKFLARRVCEDMPVILAGDFTIIVRDKYNAELVEFMKDTFELNILLYLSQATTRSNSCIDMVFG
jgi:hypothetical protein